MTCTHVYTQDTYINMNFTENCKNANKETGMQNLHDKMIKPIHGRHYTTKWLHQLYPKICVQTIHSHSILSSLFILSSYLC